MQIFSYSECQTCLVKMCCQNVCEGYRQYIYKTRGIRVIADMIDLQKCEGAVAMCIERDEPVQFEFGDYKINLEVNIVGIA
jgi:hypothetical protein